VSIDGQLCGKIGTAASINTISCGRKLGQNIKVQLQGILTLCEVEVWGSPPAAFNQNIASWNVLRVTTFSSGFDSTTALSSCSTGAIYRLWGSTLRTAYPGFINMCCASCSFIDANIGTAATAWLTSPSTATATYGNIADWDTSAVTSMAGLFYPSTTARPTFNGDISKWNVASVSNMYRVRHDSVYATY
jgi:hypothetical protein